MLGMCMQDLLGPVLFEKNESFVRTELRLLSQQAEAASIAKSRFLSNMSEEMRTPIYAVPGMLQLLGRTAPAKSRSISSP